MLGSITPAMGGEMTVTAFAVIVIGSLGNPLGTVLGGIIYGVSYMLMQSYLQLVGQSSALCPADRDPAGAAQRPARTTGAPCLGFACASAADSRCRSSPRSRSLPGLYSNHLMLFNFIMFMTLAQGINMIYGFTGYLPFGYVGFFGAGAYGFSLMRDPLARAAAHRARRRRRRRHRAGAAADAAVPPVGRLFLDRQSRRRARRAAGGVEPDLEEITKGPYGISLSGVFDPALSYATALAVLAATLALVIYLRNSHFGMALKAIREDPISAGMAGINVVRERIIAWLLSALIAGLAGGVFAWYVSVFYPETVFSVEFTIFAIVFALFGGNATVIGPILGVVILYGIYNAVGISTPQYFQLLYGALIMGLVMFLPNGLVSLLQRWGIDVP